MDSSHAFTEMTVQYLLELEWTARWVELLIMQTSQLHIVNVDCQDRAEQPQQKALSPSTSCCLTSKRTWNMATEPEPFGKNSDKDDTSGNLQSWLT